MSKLLALMCAFAAACSATHSFSFIAGSHTYTVTTQAVGVFLTYGGHWMYQPSMLVPSPATNNQWVMLFNSNVQSGQAGKAPNNEAVFMVTSQNGTTGGSPTAILYNSPSNICDMIDARPIWDGTMWHVYIQATNNNAAGQCNQLPNFVVEATGPSLTQLSWVLNPGTNIATEIVTCNNCTGPGIGEDQQWFNTAPYGGYGAAPYMVLYNNWANNPPDQIFSYLTNFSQYDYWYNSAPAWSATTGNVFPDVILGSPAGSSSGTNPAFGVDGACTNGSQTYYYMNGMGFYPAPVPYPSGSPQPGLILYGTTNVIAGQTMVIESYTSDSNGQRGFRPRFARNQYGYLDLISTGPNKWQTYIYYNDAQISKNPTDNCGYTNFGSSSQRFAVSQITITQQ